MDTSLRQIREGRGAKLEEYASQVGVDASLLSRIERGLVASLDLNVAFRIAEVYGVPVENLRPLGRRMRSDEPAVAGAAR